MSALIVSIVVSAATPAEAIKPAPSQGDAWLHHIISRKGATIMRHPRTGAVGVWVPEKTFVQMDDAHRQLPNVRKRLALKSSEVIELRLSVDHLTRTTSAALSLASRETERANANHLKWRQAERRLVEHETDSSLARWVSWLAGGAALGLAVGHIVRN